MSEWDGRGGGVNHADVIIQITVKPVKKYMHW